MVLGAADRLGILDTRGDDDRPLLQKFLDIESERMTSLMKRLSKKLAPELYLPLFDFYL